MNKSQLRKLIREWLLNDIHSSYMLESSYFFLNELKIDDLNSYEYEEINYTPYVKSYMFEDRCGNKLVATLTSTNEFKSGYKIKDVDTLIFDPKKLKGINKEKISPCPDDKRVNTIYKILLKEIIPNYVLNKKPNKLYFNPVSASRSRLIDMIINKIIQQYPTLKKKTNYIINV